MYTSILPIALSGLALVSAQNPPAPTPSSAVIIEGDPSFDGPVIPGTTGKLGNAQIVEGNPAGVAYQATLPTTNTFTNTTIRGSVKATSNANGTGLVFSVNLSGFPSEAANGPFLYHIHAMPVPPSGDCVATGPHVDPYVRGEVPPCDNTQPQTCQVGDLAGKHGNITTSPFSANYLDLYTSTLPGSNATLAGKSIVIHSYNTTRLTCANFLPVTNGTSTSNVTTASSTPVVFTGGAAANVASVGAVAAGVLAIAAFLL